MPDNVEFAIDLDEATAGIQIEPQRHLPAVDRAWRIVEYAHGRTPRHSTHGREVEIEYIAVTIDRATGRHVVKDGDPLLGEQLASVGWECECVH